MKSVWLFGGILIGLLVYQVYDHWIQVERAKCLFYRQGQCVTCEDAQMWPVGYRENCACKNRKAYYIDEGFFPAWQCLVDENQEEMLELPPISLSTQACPPHHPLKDILGNCYACDTQQPVRISHVERGAMCGQSRYNLPDQLVIKSMKCPALSDIQDPEACVACGGIVWDGKCFNEGANHFCTQNEDCRVDEWCFPLRQIKGQKGVCAKRLTNKWLCSGTDGYDLESVRAFCAGQNAHIPTLEEIENADEDLSALCPTLDMWTFFELDGAVWLDSFTQEFLFTREGESQKLGGHTFHALCHKD